MKNKLLFILLAGAMSVACSVKELETYSGGVYVNFVKEIKDSISVSFLLNPGVDVVPVTFQVELSGLASDRDLRYKVVVDETLSTASSANYVIDDHYTFGAGKYNDEFTIGVRQTPDLDDKDARLVIRLQGTEEMGLGKAEKSATIIWLTNYVTMPSWWDWRYNNLFGIYSREKYLLMIEVCDNVWDFPALPDDMRRNYAVIFARHLKENGPFYDEEGQEITSPLKYI